MQILGSSPWLSLSRQQPNERFSERIDCEAFELLTNPTGCPTLGEAKKNSDLCGSRYKDIKPQESILLH
jgi:hypothetical protein